MKQGIVFGIQFFSIHDGPGVRTAVFLKGCNMRCAWCHNPESLCARPEMFIMRERCLNCGSCAMVCPAQLHGPGADGLITHRRDPQRCIGCGSCEEACPAAAIRLMGRMMSVSQVLDQISRDRKFYGDTGGLTITGGEPMMQYDFLLELLRCAADAGIGAYMETNGSFPWEKYAALLPWLSGVLVDYKLTDPEAHRRLTGVDNARILENIGRFAASGRDVVLRCPIIPGINDTAAHFHAISDLTARHPGIRGAELMPYHKLGTSKARQLDWEDHKIQEFSVPDEAQISEWKQHIVALGGRLIT